MQMFLDVCLTVQHPVLWVTAIIMAAMDMRIIVMDIRSTVMAMAINMVTVKTDFKSWLYL
jgi:hypothetical protein